MAKDKANPFEYLNAINSGRDIISRVEDPVQAEADYVPFLTNRSLSYHIDAVMSANEMNLRPHIDKKLQFLYHLYTLKPRKRIAKWIKPETDALIEAIQAVTPMSKRKAEVTLTLLSDEQKQQIQEAYNTGEVRHERHGKPTSRSKTSR